MIKSKKYAPVLWILAGVLFLLPSIFGSANPAFIGIGMMFIILGIVFSRKTKDDSSDPEDR